LEVEVLEMEMEVLEVEARMRTITVGAMIPHARLLTCPSPSRANPVRLSARTNDCSAEASLVSLP
jgi:hypothetical protein